MGAKWSDFYDPETDSYFTGLEWWDRPVTWARGFLIVMALVTLIIYHVGLQSKVREMEMALSQVTNYMPNPEPENPYYAALTYRPQRFRRVLVAPWYLNAAAEGLRESARGTVAPDVP